MKKIRQNYEFKSKENERKKTYNKAYREHNPEEYKSAHKKANAKYKKSNPLKVKEFQKKKQIDFTNNHISIKLKNLLRKLENFTKKQTQKKLEKENSMRHTRIP